MDGPRGRDGRNSSEKGRGGLVGKKKKKKDSGALCHRWTSSDDNATRRDALDGMKYLKRRPPPSPYPIVRCTRGRGTTSSSLLLQPTTCWEASVSCISRPGNTYETFKRRVHLLFVAAPNRYPSVTRSSLVASLTNGALTSGRAPEAGTSIISQVRQDRGELVYQGTD